MKRYVGDYMTAYAGFICVVFVVGPMILAFGMLLAGDLGWVPLSVFCILFSIMMFLYTVKCSERLFTWCELAESEVIVKTWFKKPYMIRYEQCSDIGIGYYIHGVLNTDLGSKHHYIYLSHSRIDEALKCRMNHLAPSKTCLKIGYNRKTYEYFMQHLPCSQAMSLAADARKLSLLDKGT